MDLTFLTTFLTFPVANDPTVRHLVQDWQRLRHDRHALDRAARWALPGRAPATLDEVLVRSGYGGPIDDDEADAYLGQLVAIALDDDLAARVVVQRLVPALIAVERRRRRMAAHRDEPLFDELLGTAWIVIRTYPVHRRPIHVAAGLVRDCQYLQFTRPGRLRSTTREAPTSPRRVTEAVDAVMQVDEPEAKEETLDALSVARARGLGEHDVELLTAVARGETSVELARRHGVTDRAMRYRRSAALERARALLAA
jgi:hypothetical protein